jgi:hypothetical protein
MGEIRIGNFLGLKQTIKSTISGISFNLFMTSSVEKNSLFMSGKADVIRT